MDGAAWDIIDHTITEAEKGEDRNEEILNL